MRKLNFSDVSQLFQDNSSPPNCTLRNGAYRGRPIEVFDKNGEMRIPLYALIFILSVVGNTLVILTLVQNHRMRTVTNVFLLNLAISDLLLAVFCMPFTLIPQLMRNFIFGEFICVSVRYLQGKLFFSKPFYCELWMHLELLYVSLQNRMYIFNHLEVTSGKRMQVFDENNSGNHVGLIDGHYKISPDYIYLTIV